MSHSMSEALPLFSGLVVRFDQKFSSESTNAVLQTVSRSLLDMLSEEGFIAAGTFISDRFRVGEYTALCDFEPDLAGLGSHDRYIISQCLAFFGKRADIDLDVDRQAAAARKYWEVERDCELTNSCFRAWSQGRFQFRPCVERVLHAAQLKISSVLPAAPRYEDIRVRFGPGATTQTPKKNASPLVKLGVVPACSTNLERFLPELLETLPHLVEYNQDGYVDVPIHVARMFFVPKNAEIERTAENQPALNGMFQLGLGDWVADALLGVGIDLKDQSANQRAALYGSISNVSATVDLSSASDCNSNLLIDHLWPMDWTELLMQFRSAEMLSESGEYRTLQKISSMGNGFTFPVETLTFWAIAQSCVEITSPHTRIRTLVYGDDIVVDRRAWPLLREVLVAVGFKPNMRKTFADGTFRESCGCDYVSGTDVRPCFVKDALIGADFFRIHNYFVRKRMPYQAKLFEQWIHPSIRTRGPDGFGDGHLIGNIWVARSSHRKDGWSGYTFETFTHKVKHLRKEVLQRLAVESKTRKGALTYKSGQAFRVKTLALYTQYCRENRPYIRRHGRWTNDEIRREAASFQWHNHSFGQATDTEHTCVPGEGPVKRTKVYIFESPRIR